MELLRYAALPADLQRVALDDGALVTIMRRMRNGTRRAGESYRLGPNDVHAVVLHPDGSIDDCGISHNLLTNAGRDLAAAALGSLGTGISSTVATGSSATSLTASGFTTDQYKGWTVFAEESTNAPVHGDIGSNSTTVLTVDAWRNADESAGNTPGTTANYAIYPSFRMQYMGVTVDTGAAAAGDTTLASEQTGNGLARALATYAHTGGTATLTLAKTYSVTAGTAQLIHKMALFNCSNTTAGGIMGFEAVLNADANVINGDSLAITDTITLS